MKGRQHVHEGTSERPIMLADLTVPSRPCTCVGGNADLGVAV